MKKWLFKQMERLGFDSSNLKTKQEQSRFLEPGESETVTVPSGLDNTSEWRIKEWFFKKGDTINPGDIIGAIQNKTLVFEFESYVGGKFIDFKRVGEKVEEGSVLFEIKGQ